jgi:hypothetical protein
MSKYIVWLDYYTEGWKPSDELDTLDSCFEWLKLNNYGNPYTITKVVQVRFVDDGGSDNAHR